ncbi:MAG TPA: T9SS type A sorting domain-containing protein [Flavobacterium sp.]|nr:T9SS type A sorting domain-containing protein [Flavobacterium sp.]
MKKIILLAGLLLCGMAQAQIIVTGNSEEEMPDNYVHQTSSLIGQGTILHIGVENNTEETVHLKLYMEQIDNGDNNGDGTIQFCFGEVCYTQVTEGNAVPDSPTGLTLEPGESNPEGDKFQSIYGGDTPGQPVEYHMQIIQLDDEGNEIGIIKEFSFRYDPTGTVDDVAGLQNLGITVKNTVVNNMLELDMAYSATMQLFDITGKQVREVSIAEGIQSIDLSALNAAVYIAKFTTADNKTANIRIVKN